MSPATSPIRATPVSTAAQVRFPWAAIAWFGLLLFAGYGPVLSGMAYQWQNDEDMGHGLFVPLIVGYIVWERRAQLLDKPMQNNRWGLVLVALAALQLWIGTLGAEIFLQRLSFMLSLVGILLFYGGLQLLRVLAFPLLLLLFMIPVPGLLIKQVTFPLQLIASSLAEGLLQMLGYSVLREGNVLELSGLDLSVAEACSGLRALLSLSFFSLAYAYLFDSRPWMRWFLLLVTFPVALLANAGRIVFIGIIARYDRELAQGVYHTVSGWVIFVVALALLAAVHKLMTFRRSS